MHRVPMPSPDTVASRQPRMAVAAAPARRLCLHPGCLCEAAYLACGEGGETPACAEHLAAARREGDTVRRA